MTSHSPILQLDGVHCTTLFGAAARNVLELTLQPGDLALVDSRDVMLSGAFADLCCGLLRPEEGRVHFLERDWLEQRQEVADALRGRIGRISENPGWLRFLDARTNILLKLLHHTRTDAETLSAEALKLAHHFGLPGIPSGSIGKLSQSDLTRASFVRAFLGDPKLVILESPVQGQFSDMISALLNQIARIRDLGGAAIWLTRSRIVWDNRIFPATHRYRLDHQGLSAIGAVS